MEWRCSLGWVGQPPDLVVSPLIFNAGDKANHIATLHLPQMLYIWPYILFFSFPLLYQNVVERCLPLHLFSSGTSFLRSTIIVATTTILMLLTVHYNTIVHPFTLADNRHYVFYIFRWILLRHPLVKYLAVPIYIISSRAALSALEASPPPLSSPQHKSQDHDSSANRVSFILIFLLTSTLSLITAPLVEPRYFILPWLIWRLHLPHPQQTVITTSNQQQCHRRTIIINLWLETAWFLLINLTTCYVFLYRGFAWSQQPGQVQRFMW